MKKIIIILLFLFVFAPNIAFSFDCKAIWDWTKKEMKVDYDQPIVNFMDADEFIEFWTDLAQPSYDKMLLNGIDAEIIDRSIYLYSRGCRGMYVKEFKMIFVPFWAPKSTIAHEMVHFIQDMQGRLNKYDRDKLEGEAYSIEKKYSKK